MNRLGSVLTGCNQYEWGFNDNTMFYKPVIVELMGSKCDFKNDISKEFALKYSDAYFLDGHVFSDDYESVIFDEQTLTDFCLEYGVWDEVDREFNQMTNFTMDYYLNNYQDKATKYIETYMGLLKEDKEAIAMKIKTSMLMNFEVNPRQLNIECGYGFNQAYDEEHGVMYQYMPESDALSLEIYEAIKDIEVFDVPLKDVYEEIREVVSAFSKEKNIDIYDMEYETGLMVEEIKSSFTNSLAYRLNLPTFFKKEDGDSKLTFKRDCEYLLDFVDRADFEFGYKNNKASLVLICRDESNRYAYKNLGIDTNYSYEVKPIVERMSEKEDTSKDRGR